MCFSWNSSSRSGREAPKQEGRLDADGVRMGIRQERHGAAGDRWDAALCCAVAVLTEPPCCGGMGTRGEPSDVGEDEERFAPQNQSLMGQQELYAMRYSGTYTAP